MALFLLLDTRGDAVRNMTVGEVRETLENADIADIAEPLSEESYIVVADHEHKTAFSPCLLPILGKTHCGVFLRWCREWLPTFYGKTSFDDLHP